MRRPESKITGNYGLTIIEVIQVLGISERKIRSLIADGDIPHFNVGRSIRVPSLGLQKWIDNGGTK